MNDGGALARRPPRDLLGTAEVVADDDAAEAELPADQALQHRGGERGRVPGVDAGVVRRGRHEEQGAGADAGGERRQVGVVRGGDGVGHPGAGVGVGPDPPQPGEVLDRGGDARGRHTGDERGAVAGDGGGRVAELAPVVADRRVRPRGGGAGDRVHHRREVEVDAGPGELAAPDPRRALQRRRGPAALGQRGGHAREPGPLQDLHVAALLVGRHHQRDAAGGRGGRRGLQPAGHRPRRRRAGVAAAGEDDRPHVLAGDHPQRRRARDGARGCRP